MKKILYKISLLIIVTIFCLIFTGSNANAATASISASRTNVKVGENVAIHVMATAVSWNLKVTGEGISDSIPGFNTDGQSETITKTYTLDTSKAGVFTVAVAGDVTDGDGTVKIYEPVTITVAEEPTPTATPVPTETQTVTSTPTTTSTPTSTPTSNEPSFDSRNEIVYATDDDINVRPTCSTSGGAYGKLAKGESVIRTGIAQVNGENWSRVVYTDASGVQHTGYVSSKYLTITKQKKDDDKKKEEEDNKKDGEKSSVKNLKTLTIVGYELEPSFDPEIKNYSLKLNEDDTDDELEIKAEAEDEKAKVTITGNENFKIGNNIVKIVVTAEDNTTRMYTITVAKTNENGIVDSLKLDKLTISKGNLDPAFDPEVTSYTIIVDDPSTITSSDIIATSDDKDIKVTVAENKQSDDGEKLFTIMLENKDSTKTGVYQVVVKKPTANQAATTNNTDMTLFYILGGIIGGLLIIIIIIIIILKKNSDDDDEEYDDSFIEPNNNLDYKEMTERKPKQSQILNDGSEGFNSEDDDKYKVNYLNTNYEEDEEDTDSDDDYEDDEDYDNEEDSEEYNQNEKKGKHF